MVNKPFAPRYGATITIATAAAAVNADISASEQSLLIVNAAQNVVFVRVKPQGNNADATAADMPVAANGSRVITKDPNSQAVISVFSPDGAVGNVYVCPGEGWGGH